MNLDLIDIFLLFATALNVGILFLSISSIFKSKANLSFLGINIGLVLWVGSNFLIDRSAEINIALFWTTLSGVGIIIFFLSLSFFALTYTNIISNSSKIIYLLLCLIPGIILLLILVFTDLLIKDININTFPVKVNYGDAYTLIVFWTLINIVFAFSQLLYVKFKINDTLVKKQINIIISSFSFLILFTFFTNLILPLTGISSFVRIGPVSSIIIAGMVTFLILKYQFLDIRILLGRISYFLLLSIILVIAYRITLGIDAVLWGDPYNLQSLITAIPIALVVVVFYDAFKKFIQEKIDSTLINPDFDPKEIIAKFNNDVSTILSYEDIIDHSLDIIGKTLRPRYKGMIVKVKNELELTDDIKGDKVIDLNFDTLVKIWKDTDNYPIIQDEIEIDFPKVFRPFRDEIAKVVEVMEENQIKVILPISSPTTIVGILLIGQREADSPYNSVQIDYLASLTNLTGLSLTRSFLYEEVREFNETLKKKVELATSELEKQNNELQESLSNERDMLDILGHELRTPLGIIRNSIGLLEITHKAKTLDDEGISKFIHVAQNNIRREVQLLETILASAKIDNAKLDLIFEKAEGNTIIEDSFDSYKYEAEKKKLELKMNLPKESIPVYVDKLRIQQVLDNLVSNSIKYTETGSIEIGIKDENDFVRYYVKDTGMGIPEEDLKKLGQKFFRVNNYLESEGMIGDRKIVRPGGNGIGLYVVYQLVKYMGGEVKVESKLGKGSTFSFTVQKYTPEVESRHNLLKETSPKALVADPKIVEKETSKEIEKESKEGLPEITKKTVILNTKLPEKEISEL